MYTDIFNIKLNKQYTQYEVENIQIENKLTQAYLHHTVRWCSDEVVCV